MDVRRAEESEVDRLATVWHDGWRDAHAALLPAELARERTWESLRERMAAALTDVRVVGPPGAPIGFSMTRDDQLYQLFVSEEARGTGAASALMAEVERRMFDEGVRVAWLSCAIGNVRAARFYEKSGWRLVGTVVERMMLESGELELEVWRYENELAGSTRPARAAPR